VDGSVGVMRGRRFTAALFAIALVVVPAAAGCGYVTSGSSVPVTQAMAYSATMNENSADVDVTYAFTTGNHKFGGTTAESGPVSWATGQGELAMTATIDGRLSTTTQQIIDGRHTYTKTSIKGLPASAQAGLPGVSGWSETTWTGASSADLSGILPTLLFWGLFNPAGMASPASLLVLLRAQASSVQNLGGEVLDGINTTHYRADIPLSRLGASSAAELQQAEQALGTSSIGVDYWIDSSDLLRQLRVAITAPRQPGAATSSPGQVTVPLSYPVTLSVNLRLSNYGTPVHVVPPSPAQITSRVSCLVSKDGFNCTS
jgi:hypothetical protein